MIQREKQKFVGVVKKRLYDSEKLKIYEQAKEAGMDEEYLEVLHNLASKKLFQANFLWKLLNKLFNIDVRSFLTGKFVLETIDHNLITTRGKQVIIDLLGGITTAPVKYIAIGSGTTSPVASDTELETEIVASGGERALVSPTHTTIDTTNDTVEFSNTFTATDTLSVSEEGLFDNSSGGNMLARNTFSAVPLSANDSLQIVHQIKAEVS